MWKIKRKNIIVYISIFPFSVVAPESFMEKQESFENRQNGFFFVKLWSLSARHGQVKLIIATFSA